MALMRQLTKLFPFRDGWHRLLGRVSQTSGKLHSSEVMSVCWGLADCVDRTQEAVDRI